MMWVLFSLSIIEIGVVHLLLTLLWPAIGWPVTILSVIGAIWLAAFIRSLSIFPHEIEGDILHLRLGRLKSIELQREQICYVTASWKSEQLKAKYAINLAAIAHPNRCLRLHAPLPSGKDHVFARFDDPHDFDRAMLEWGVSRRAD